MVQEDTGEVKVAIEAPKHIDILREEIFDKDYGFELSPNSVDKPDEKGPKISFKRVKTRAFSHE